MQKVIKIEIECGERTCETGLDMHCKMMGASRRFRKETVCMLFRDEQGSPQELFYNPLGWAQRCPACLEAAP